MSARATVESVDATLRVVHHALASSVQSVRNRIFVALQSSAVDAEGARHLQLIDRQVTRLEAQMARLLVLTPALAPLRRERVAPSELVGAVLEKLGEPRERVEVQLTGDAPIEIDREQMVGALVELVGNALAHSPPRGEVVLRVGVEGDAWVASVLGGVSRAWPDPVDRALDPLVSEASERLGLGLAAARLVAESHGGRLELSAGRPEASTPTLVTLTIPRGATGA